MKAHTKENALDKIIKEEEEKLQEMTMVDSPSEDGQQCMNIPFPDPDPWAVNELDLLVEQMKKEHSNLDDASLRIRYIRHIGEASDIYNASRVISPGLGIHPLTRKVLNCLWQKVPLTPIEDKEEEWEPCKGSETEDSHKRAPYVIRTKQPDGSYKYSDEQRILGFENHRHYWLGSLVDIFNEIRPIEFPYEISERRHFANTMSFLTQKYSYKDKKKLYRRGSRVYDTLGIFSIVCPDGEVIPVGKYYKWDESGIKIEISYDEFLERKKKSENWINGTLKKAEAKNE